MDGAPDYGERARRMAERVREACIAEALRAYEDAGLSGLCHEGRFEAAISALRVLDVVAIATPRAGPDPVASG